MSQKLVMVMGVQRSGTNALFNSFARDPDYLQYNESDDSEVFFDWNLRPEIEIRGILCGPKPVLMKPVNESDFREVIDVAREYVEYDMWIPWIYRDPVDVYSSWWIKWRMPTVDGFIEMWNRRNRSILKAMAIMESKIGIMRYEHLIGNPKVFEHACDFFGIKGQNQFHQSSNEGRRIFSQDVILKIEMQTCEVLSQLDAALTFTGD